MSTNKEDLRNMMKVLIKIVMKKLQLKVAKVQVMVIGKISGSENKDEIKGWVWNKEKIKIKENSTIGDI